MTLLPATCKSYFLIFIHLVLTRNAQTHFSTNLHIRNWDVKKCLAQKRMTRKYPDEVSVPIIELNSSLAIYSKNYIGVFEAFLPSTQYISCRRHLLQGETKRNLYVAVLASWNIVEALVLLSQARAGKFLVFFMLQFLRSWAQLKNLVQQQFIHLEGWLPHNSEEDWAPRLAPRCSARMWCS